MTWTCESCGGHRHFGDYCIDCGTQQAYKELFEFVDWIAENHPKEYKRFAEEYILKSGTPPINRLLKNE